MAIINLSSNLFPNVIGTPFGDLILSVNDPAIENSGGPQTMYGGLGSDTYVINASTQDSVVEFVGEGTDLVVLATNFNYVLTANVENLIDRGLGGPNLLTGNALNNSIAVDDLGGTGTTDSLDGGLGNDTLAGGGGSDTYTVDSAGDVVNEVANTFSTQLINGFAILTVANGTDLVNSSVSWILGANIENLTLTGTLNTNGTGNALNNVIRGHALNNVLDGAAGDDSLDGGGGSDTLRGGGGRDTLNGTTSNATLDGGMGDDIYLIDSLSDSISGDAGGLDWVELNNAALNNFVVHAAIENVLVGTATATRITGNALDNYLAGNTAADTLIGGAGNDVLDGAGGIDNMTGGLGDDVYVVDNAGDVTAEGPGGGGIDSVYSGVAWQLAPNIERLILTGISNAEGQGNAANNFIGGNSGNNVLKGFEGNDTLDGAGGFDAMSGGKGNDTYFVDNVSGPSRDLVFEMAGPLEGNDVVNSSVDILGLYDNVERLVLTGTANLIGRGNALANRIDGNAGNNELDGAGGNDTLAGDRGADRYIIDAITDSVIEVPNVLAGGVVQAGSIDTVIYRGTGTYTVAPNVEIARIDLVTNGINLTGNGEHNTLYGSNGTNLLSGGIGDDSLYGGGGNDSLIGGGGNDILDGQGGADSLSGGIGDDTYVFSDLSDVVDETGGGGIDTVITNRRVTDLGMVSVFKGQVENIVLAGGALSATGNSFNNVLTGNGLANTLTGGGGNDTYNADPSDTIVESIGGGTADLVRLNVTSAGTYVVPFQVEHVTLLGAASHDVVVLKGAAPVNNNLTGNDFNNLLNGADGSDVMTGLKGDDTYYVDNAGDRTIEAAGGGIDTVFSTVTYALTAEVENLNLVGNAPANGTGNALDNFIRGNGFANNLAGAAGNDTLDGGGGNDTLNGADGNDTYVVDRLGDSILDTTGIDTVISTAATWTLGGGLENLVLFNGWALPHNQNGVGNSLNNIISGNAGDNLIDGAGGNDLFEFSTFGTYSENDEVIGGDGNDTLSADISDLNDHLQMGGVESLMLRASVSNGIVDLDDVNDLQTIIAKSFATWTVTIEELHKTGSAFPTIVIQDYDGAALTVNPDADTLTGGGGNDDLLTFVVRDSGLNTTVNTTLAEKIRIDNQSAAEGNIASNTISDGFTGATLIEVTGSGGTGLVLNGFDGATLTAGTTTFRVTDYNDRLTLQQDAGSGGVADAITVSVHNSNFWLDIGQSAADRDFETINLSSSASGTGSWLHLNEAATWMNGALVIDGSTALSVDGITAATVDASGFAGPTLYLRSDSTAPGTYTGPTAAAVNVTMIGGTSGETFTFATAGALSDTDFIDGNGGNDVVEINITDVSVGPHLDNVRTVRVTNTGTGELDGALVSGGGLGVIELVGSPGTLTTINNLVDHFDGRNWTGNATVIAANNGAHIFYAGTGTYTLLGNPDAGAPGDEFVMGTTLDSSDTINGFDFTLTGQDSMTASLNTATTYAPTIGGVENLQFAVNANAVVDGTDIVGATFWSFSSGGPVTLQMINLHALNGTLVVDASGLAGAATIAGSSGDDAITGGTTADSLTGGMGDDTLMGNPGADVLRGDEGDDILIGMSDADSLFGGDGDDRLVGGNGNDDMLDGGAGRDTADYSGAGSAVTIDLGAGSANDGSAGIDTIVPGTIESVIGSAFTDTLTGNHVTVLTHTSADMATILEGRASNDTLDGGGSQAGYIDLASYANESAAVNVNLGAGTATGATAGTDTLTNIDGAIGSGFADMLVGGSPSAAFNQLFEIFVGLGGSDTIAGSAGALSGTVDAGDFDMADYGFDANSVFVDLRLGTALDGTGSTDLLYDITHVRGSMFSDILAGGDPNNDAFEYFEGMAGNDHIDGGSGNDVASFRNSEGAVNASLQNGSALDGYGGVDSLVNIEGLVGGDFNDTLTGSGGANQFEGGVGNDLLTGGAGTDSFVFNTVLGATNVDTIADFVVADDSIRLEDAIFGGLSAGALAGSAFHSAADIATGGTPGQFILYDSDSGQLYYDANGDGDGSNAVLFANLTGNPALTAGDFVIE